MTESPAPSRTDAWRAWRWIWTAGGFYLVLCLAMFGTVLFAADDRVLSAHGTDLFAQFAHYHPFGFREIRQGNLPLWNPHLFCGLPYFGGLQSALLYPPNALFLLLPPHRAFNLLIVLHAVLTATGMFAWARQRSLQPVAAGYAGLVAMLGGAYFLHITPGHFPTLCAMAWSPWILLALEGWQAEHSPRRLLGGMAAVALQILAGHPQTVYYTALAAGLATVLAPAGARRGLALAAAAAVYGGAALLAACPLLAAWSAGGESLRAGGLALRDAAVFSFPPENLLTLLAPGLFGAPPAIPYWGRCYFWEMTPFIGVTGLTLAVAGVAWGTPSRKRRATGLALLLFLLALGAHLPWYPWLHAWLPGFNLFRGTSKFLWPAMLFMTMLAGIGLNELAAKPPDARRLKGMAAALAVLAAALALAAVTTSAGAVDSWWNACVRLLHATGESELPAARLNDPALLASVTRQAARALAACAATLLLLALFLHVARRRRLGVWLMLLLGAGELALFTARHRPTFPFRGTRDPELAALAARLEPGARILDLVNPNAVMSAGLANVWGYDPGVTRRYAEFMAFTQGLPPDAASPYLAFSQVHRLHRLLRLRAVRAAPGVVHEGCRPFPEVCLIGAVQVAATREAVFGILARETFDPEREAVLEQRPAPWPEGVSARDTARVVGRSTDFLMIEAETERPSLLLISAAYSRGWRATPLAGSAQSAYAVLPANYTLCALPLQAGRHRLRLGYSPAAFRIGRVISLAAAALWLLALVHAGGRA